MKQQGIVEKITVFISYTPDDRLARNQLGHHLSSLKHAGIILERDQESILPGSDYDAALAEEIRSADVILLLISADFLASDVCEKVVQQALQRHRHGEAQVIPILLRPCDWQSFPFAHFQYLPSNGQPVTTWDNQDDAWRSVAQELRRVVGHQRSPQPSLSHADSINRLRLLKRVHKIWIEGLLEHALHQAAWIDLQFQDQPDALENPWHLAYQEMHQPSRPLPPSTNIIQVYDNAEGELLILGEPGSGKTTLLLQLARTLLRRAETDIRHPMPVLFNLSSWAQRQLPLDQWLVVELQEKYRVHPSLGRSWVEHHDLLLLLDGLDEVSAEARVGCVQAIMVYHHNQPDQVNSSLVICSRIQEYQDLVFHLQLNQAVSILPLTDQQVDIFISSINNEADGLRHLLATEPEFAALVHSPLMLSIAALAFRGKRVVNFPSPDNFPSSDNFPAGASQKQLYQIIFSSYVEQMLKRRGQIPTWMEKQFLVWLSFLAKQLRQGQQTVFLLEDLQPTWLPETQQRFFRWTIGLVFGLVFGSLLGLVFGLLGGAILGPLGALLLGLLFGSGDRLLGMLLGAQICPLVVGLIFWS